jgi:hypothetical protein
VIQYNNAFITESSSHDFQQTLRNAALRDRAAIRPWAEEFKRHDFEKYNRDNIGIFWYVMCPDHAQGVNANIWMIQKMSRQCFIYLKQENFDG